MYSILVTKNQPIKTEQKLNALQNFQTEVRKRPK